ncbi:hypothetical protein [Dyadobacter sp. NIV53]|uniref:hypothetical protein n=1 Tax=Dyadobacter sp. NIV53 TaxID=2861765 RepID=UPI001C88CE4F|nr:hypothetical protein [Dyadobacter sp. NIV53]
MASSKEIEKITRGLIFHDDLKMPVLMDFNNKHFLVERQPMFTEFCFLKRNGCIVQSENLVQVF